MLPELYRIHAEIESRHWWFEARRRILYPLVDRLMAGRSGLVVDGGCGTGGSIAPLAGKYRCLGLDHCAEAIDMARHNFPACEFRVGIVPDSILDVAAQVDLVMLMDVIEHIEDDHGALARLVEALSAGARILLTVPADMTLWSRHDETAMHFRRYDRAGLRAVWHGLPVRELMMSSFNTHLYWPIRAVRTVTRLLGAAAGRGNTDFALPPAPLNRLLTGLMAAEAGPVAAALDDPAKGFHRGVSLVAILERVPS